MYRARDEALNRNVALKSLAHGALNLSAARAFALVAPHFHSSARLLRNSDRARATIAGVGEVRD